MYTNERPSWNSNSALARPAWLGSPGTGKSIGTLCVAHVLFIAGSLWHEAETRSVVALGSTTGGVV